MTSQLNYGHSSINANRYCGTDFGDPCTVYLYVTQARNIEFTSLTMAAGCMQTLDSMLDIAAKTEAESWFLIDKLHLAPDSVLAVLKKRLQRAVRTKGRHQISIVLHSCTVAVMIFVQPFHKCKSMPIYFSNVCYSLINMKPS